MSQPAGDMIQEASGLRVHVYQGGSWPAFFFGPFWYLAKGMWTHGLIYLAICVLSAGIGWILGLFIVPFLANRQHQEYLAKQGYRRPTSSSAVGI